MTDSRDIEIHGRCDPRFAPVREAFAKSFTTGEVGAAVAIFHEGEPVVDLWAGHRNRDRSLPWERDTLVNVYSTTKGMTALCANRLVEAGRLDLDAPVADYWPEFAQAGKGAIPVRWLLSHQAGLAAIERPLVAEDLADWDRVTSALAGQSPNWEPGTLHGYHALTFGHLVGEVVRRVDGRSLGTYFREELAEPLSLDFHIGLAAQHDARCADLIPAPPPPPGAPDLSSLLRGNPDSLAARVFANPAVSPETANSRLWRGAEIPAANGHGDARSIARIYGALCHRGEIDGVHVLGEEALERAIAEQAFGADAVLEPLQTRFGLGFFLTQPMIPFGPNPRSFGHPGAGGSIGFGDPDTGIGFGYVMNQMQMGLAGGAHGFALIHALYESLSN